MAKCPICNKKMKFSRKCTAVDQVICTKCFGSKKGLEIQCTDDCKFFIENKIKANKSNMVKLVKKSFNKESEDIYKDARILGLVMPFEQFIFGKYYNDINFNDDFIFDCYMKMFYLIDGQESIYTFNEVETEIFDEFSRIAKETEMPIESQKLILVRMMKSVDSVTGGNFGNRMYLELLRNHFNETGIVADVMKGML